MGGGEVEMRRLSVMFYLSIYTIVLWRYIDSYSINTLIGYICMMVYGVCIFQQLIIFTLIEIDEWKEKRNEN